MSELKSKQGAWIILISLLIPTLITLIFYMDKAEGYDFSFLPVTYAITNGLTFCLLLLAFRAIKKKDITQHKRLMYLCLGLGLYFLVAYVLYHSTTPNTTFGGDGSIRTIYYVILLSHILLSAVIVPLILITYVRALNQRYDRHKKIARITLPLWLYVTLTGVIVYLMISPYYPQ